MDLTRHSRLPESVDGGRWVLEFRCKRACCFLRSFFYTAGNFCIIPQLHSSRNSELGIYRFKVGTMQLLKAKMFVPNVQGDHPFTTSVKFSDKLTCITLLNAHIPTFGK